MALFNTPLPGFSGGHITLLCILNSFIHVVMYGYYLLAAMGPRVRPYLWWKKYLTTMQMIQFVIIFVHSFQVSSLSVSVAPGVQRAYSGICFGGSWGCRCAWECGVDGRVLSVQKVVT